MSFDDGGWCLGIWLTGIGLAVVLCAIGLVRVIGQGLSLKARLDAYTDLPIVALAHATQVSTARLPQTIADAKQLLPRMQRALIAMQEARDSLERSAASTAAGVQAVGNFFAKWRKR